MRDPRTEAFLDRGQWHWTYEPTVIFDEIDLPYSADNPARLNRKIDDERVLQYAEEMQDGVEFPAIVLVTPSDRGVNPYDVATGMHRLRASDMAQSNAPKRVDAYVVTEPDRYRREVLTRRLNTIEGRGVDNKEQIIHVIYLHEQFKLPISTLAKEWHLKESVVRKHLRAEQACKRAREFGFDLNRAKISVTTQGMLHSSIHSDRVFGEVVRFVVMHGPPPTVIDDICRNIRDLRDEAQALAIVHSYIQAEEERQERERAKTARTRSGPAQTMIANAGRFNKHVSQGIDLLFLSSLTGPDKMKARAFLDDVISNAKRIIAELDRIEQINAGKIAA